MVKWGVHGKGVCMAKEVHAWQGDMHGGGCMVGGHAWQGPCMVGGGMCGGGMNGRGMHARGICDEGGMCGKGSTHGRRDATAADGTQCILVLNGVNTFPYWLMDNVSI